jgi:predicted RNA binding protein YcfA (HicA-like mRNA interferase family)
MGKGGHMIYRHAGRAGPIVVASGGKLNRDVPKGTQNAILRQAGLK